MVKYLLPAVLVILVLTLVAPAASASAVAFGFGASGGLSVPIVQDDQARGSDFSLRAMIRPVSLLAVEANVHFAQYGSPDFGLAGVTNDLDGSDLTAFGVDALLGGGPGRRINPFILTGIGFYSLSREQTKLLEEESTQFGWSLGMGLAIGLTHALSIDVRTRLNIVPDEGSSSRKSAFVLGGLNYYFGTAKGDSQ